MIINNELSMKIKDIRQNRISMLRYIKVAPDIASYHTYNGYYFVYQDGFLICENDIRTAYGRLLKVAHPLIFMDLKLVKYIEVG